MEKKLCVNYLSLFVCNVYHTSQSVVDFCLNHHQHLGIVNALDNNKYVNRIDMSVRQEIIIHEKFTLLLH